MRSLTVSSVVASVPVVLDRRAERCVCIVCRREVCFWGRASGVVVVVVVGEGRDDEVEVEEEEERRDRGWGRGEVWVPKSRWKSSVGSSSSDELPALSASSFASSAAAVVLVLSKWCDFDFGCCAAAGIADTTLSSFAFILSRSVFAVSASSCRAAVRVSAMGARMYLLRP